ncbi:CaiB/BaiF CoA transferase family protein [Ilumatobacter sp.]|uniref:CaiB/BaiF CoA transferase family protein n=1 Tax=Ilumatobacter sp. TaxID=1967498 RepID=UPI003C6712F2
MTAGIRPLDGITVIEVDSWMAAPSAGAILADLGADVIKVEPLGGDAMRGTGRPAKVEGPFKGYDFVFDVDNRGKRSIAVDLASSDGAAVVQRLAGTADIFLCNLLPHRQQRFGLDPVALLEQNPTIVHATLTGYGTHGPEAWRPGYDVTAFFGRSGLYDSMRETSTGLVPMARPAQGDHAAGLALVTNILAALRLVDRIGEGQVVEVSLYETAAWTLASDYGVTATDRAPVRQRSRTQQITPLTNRYPCGDDRWVVFNMPEAPAFARFCGAVGLEHLVDDERFDSVRNRFVNMAELVELIDEALSARGRDEWGPIFDEHRLIWGPVLGLHEVVVDDQAEAMGMFPTIDHPELGEYRSVRSPIRLKGVDTAPTAPAPSLGEHGRSVLAEAGLSTEEIDALVAAGVIGSSGVVAEDT